MEDLNLVEGTYIELTKSGTNVSVNCTGIGDLDELDTTAKTDVVSAINEVYSEIGDIGDALDEINNEVIN
jgi:hypothetical protein